MVRAGNYRGDVMPDHLKWPVIICEFGAVFDPNHPEKIGFAMGCVKGDDSEITWDSKAMEDAK